MIDAASMQVICSYTLPGCFIAVAVVPASPSTRSAAVVPSCFVFVSDTQQEGNFGSSVLLAGWLDSGWLSEGVHGRKSSLLHEHEPLPRCDPAVVGLGVTISYIVV